MLVRIRPQLKHQNVRKGCHFKKYFSNILGCSYTYQSKFIVSRLEYNHFQQSDQPLHDYTPFAVTGLNALFTSKYLQICIYTCTGKTKIVIP